MAFSAQSFVRPWPVKNPDRLVFAECWFERFVGAVKHAVEALPSLAHRVGAETAANTATPETAGELPYDASLAAPVGDMRVPVRAPVEVPTAHKLLAAVMILGPLAMAAFAVHLVRALERRAEPDAASGRFVASTFMSN
jgi:hypothetical protein